WSNSIRTGTSDGQGANERRAAQARLVGTDYRKSAEKDSGSLRRPETALKALRSIVHARAGDHRMKVDQADHPAVVGDDAVQQFGVDGIAFRHVVDVVLGHGENVAHRIDE